MCSVFIRFRLPKLVALMSVLQVKDLQSRLDGLAREKDEALSLKTQTEEQFSVLQAQLRAKVSGRLRASFRNPHLCSGEIVL